MWSLMMFDIHVCQTNINIQSQKKKNPSVKNNEMKNKDQINIHIIWSITSIYFSMLHKIVNKNDKHTVNHVHIL